MGPRNALLGVPKQRHAGGRGKEGEEGEEGGRRREEGGGGGKVELAKKNKHPTLRMWGKNFLEHCFCDFLDEMCLSSRSSFPGSGGALDRSWECLPLKELP